MSFENNAPKLGLQYSENNDFFQENIDFLQKIGFISILSIDMDIKYSFQKTNRDTIIQGAEIETYDNDHMINDNFFVHKITIPKETNITRSLVYIKLHQTKSITIKDIATFIRSIPMVSLLIFFIISLFIPGFFGTILKWISGISMIIFIFFFIYKLIKYLFEITKMKNKSLQGDMITYNNPHDLKIFTKAAKEKIKELGESGVTDIAIDRNTFYLKQDLIDDSKTSTIGLLFGKRKTVSSEKKEEIMNKMIDILSEQSLLNVFKEENDI